MRKPDFTGEWILNREASVLSPEIASAVLSGTLRIDHREPAFLGHQTIVFIEKPIESRFELRSDGREVGTSGGGPEVVSSLRWDGDALVAGFRIQTPGGELRISFRYELLDDGRRLRASEQLRGAGREQDNLWMFERK